MEPEYRSAQELVKRVLADPTLLEKVKTDPAKELPEIADNVVRDLPPPLQSDVWIYRVVVSSLGTAVLLSILGAIVLSALKITPAPELLTAIGSAAVGALAGLLAPSPTK